MKISLQVNRLLTKPAGIAGVSGLPPEFQSSTRSDEVVVNIAEAQLSTEPVFASCAGRQPTAQVEIHSGDSEGPRNPVPVVVLGVPPQLVQR